MEKLLLRCYAILITFVALILIGLVNQSMQVQVAETPEQSAIISDEPLPSKSKSPIEAGMYSVVDGDTLIVSDSADKGKQYRVRLIGADTPETVKSGNAVEAFGLDASEFTKQMIAEAGNKVRRAFDGDATDRYNRILAMVYLTMPDGSEVWLNERLIREGLAHARLDYRYSHEAKLSFAVAEVEARRNKRNLWGNGEF